MSQIMKPIPKTIKWSMTSSKKSMLTDFSLNTWSSGSKGPTILSKIQQNLMISWGLLIGHWQWSTISVEIYHQSVKKRLSLKCSPTLSGSTLRSSWMWRKSSRRLILTAPSSSLCISSRESASKSSQALNLIKVSLSKSRIYSASLSLIKSTSSSRRSITAIPNLWDSW